LFNATHLISKFAYPIYVYTLEGSWDNTISAKLARHSAHFYRRWLVFRVPQVRVDQSSCQRVSQSVSLSVSLSVCLSASQLPLVERVNFAKTTTFSCNKNSLKMAQMQLPRKYEKNTVEENRRKAN